MPHNITSRGWALLALLGVWTLLAGCTPPPPPPSARNLHHSDDEDENDSWLFKRLTGKTKKPPKDDATVAQSTMVQANPAPAAAAPAAPPGYPPPAAYSNPPPGAYSNAVPPPQYPTYPPQNPYPDAALPSPNPASGPPSGYQPVPWAHPAPAPAYAPATPTYGQPAPGYVPATPATYQNAPPGSPPNPNDRYPPSASNVRPSGVVSTTWFVASPPSAGPSGATPRYDPNVVPVGATDVGPMMPDPIPPMSMGPPPQPPQSATTNQGPQPIATAPVPPKEDKKEEDTGWDWTHLAPEQAWKDAKKAFGYGPDEKIAREAFAEGQKLFKEKKFEEAAGQFHTASWRWPDSLLEEDSLFLEGESYFFADKYSSAFDAYGLLLKQHDNSRYLDTVMQRAFAIGRYWEQVDDKAHHWPVTPNVTDKTRPWFDTAGNAISAYNMVRLHDPTGPLADCSVMAIANYHFRHGDWEEAAYHYDLLRKDYPKSKFQKEAHLLGLQSKLRMYQGARYAAEPLKDAKEIATQTLTQFHGRLGEEESRVAETRAQIIAQEAAREWEVAQYYDNKKQFGAARYYYRGILEKYAQTPYGEKARSRMEEIKSEPDTPPNRFKWLTEVFERKN